MSQQLENMTLRNKLNEAERLIRELIHHIEHGYIPKAHLLRRTARKGNDPKEQHEITDMTVRGGVEKVLKSDQFSRQLCHQLQGFLGSIEQDVNKIIGN
ncbi:hypothetical protein [Thalassoglobus sp.]|uniref:hypothetical protein n=1 Tax=Thalassoglobus sp. TaxID=2795869 RepID=UPI003AA7F63D